MNTEKRYRADRGTAMSMVDVSRDEESWSVVLGDCVVMWSRLFDRACGYFGRPSSTSTGFGAWWFMLCSVFNNNAPFGSLLML